MTGARKPERQREIEALRALALTLIDFFCSLEDGAGAVSIGMLREPVEAAYEKRSLTGLRMVKNDLIGMLQAVPASTLSRLDLLLRERLSMSVDELLARQLARVERIRARGRILNDTQYYLVREHLEMIWDDARSRDQAAQLQALLTAYEERAANRRRRESE